MFILNSYKRLSQICKQCNVDKSINEYEWSSNRPNPRTTCKVCRYFNRDIKKENEQSKSRKKEWSIVNKDIIRQKAEKRLYGITKEELGQTCCQICGGTQRLSIDHNHTTGKVRGLLCSPCNTAIGNFKENPDTMLKAITYLKEHNG